jgi:hypothetical protein
MQFRVSAIQDEGTPASMNEARCRLEDQLNAELRNLDFGDASTNILIVVFCTASLTEPPPASRLTRNEDGSPLLALHVSMDPEVVHRTPHTDHFRLLCNEVASRLPRHPARTPRGLQYQRLHHSMVACSLSAVHGAA